MKKKLIIALIILTGLLLLAVPIFAQDEIATGLVTGRIVNRSPDGVVPEKLDLMLHAWDENFVETLMVDGYSEANGTFEFADVLLDPDLLYAVMLTRDDAIYASEPVKVAEGQTELSVDISIYESTTDTSSVRIDRQHVIFDAALNGLRVAEIYILSNNGDRTISGQVAGVDAQLSSLQFPLPEGATDISFNQGNSGGRFMLTPGGFVDTEPLRPGVGTGQVAVTYVLPYKDSLIYSSIARWPVESLSFMLTTDIGLSLEGENLIPAGTRDMGEGGQVELFTHDGLASDESVIVTVSGTLLQPLVAPSGDMVLETDTNTGFSSKKGLALGGVTLGLALMAVGVWWYRRPEPEEKEEAEGELEGIYDHLVTQIALLDEARDRSEINRSEYEKRREQMVRQAKSLLEQATDQDTASPSPSY
ncbi:MAG TPA: hypothetical protein VFI27_06745 [candidate division Zixibacteria bacterium]|nr:hypothetical protein [candidate division Zixibacteria bacterium]